MGSGIYRIIAHDYFQDEGIGLGCQDESTGEEGKGAV